MTYSNSYDRNAAKTSNSSRILNAAHWDKVVSDCLARQQSILMGLVGQLESEAGYDQRHTIASHGNTMMGGVSVDIFNELRFDSSSLQQKREATVADRGRYELKDEHEPFMTFHTVEDMPDSSVGQTSYCGVGNSLHLRDQKQHSMHSSNASNSSNAMPQRIKTEAIPMLSKRVKQSDRTDVSPPPPPPPLSNPSNSGVQDKYDALLRQMGERKGIDIPSMSSDLLVEAAEPDIPPPPEIDYIIDGMYEGITATTVAPVKDETMYSPSSVSNDVQLDLVSASLTHMPHPTVEQIGLFIANAVVDPTELVQGPRDVEHFTGTLWKWLKTDFDEALFASNVACQALSDHHDQLLSLKDEQESNSEPMEIDWIGYDKDIEKKRESVADVDTDAVRPLPDRESVAGQVSMRQMNVRCDKWRLESEVRWRETIVLWEKNMHLWKAMITFHTKAEAKVKAARAEEARLLSRNQMLKDDLSTGNRWILQFKSFLSELEVGLFAAAVCLLYALHIFSSCCRLPNLT